MTGDDAAYQNHFRAMLGNPSRNIDLRTMAPAIPGTFMLIDDQYFAWEMCEYDETVWRSACSIGIDDARCGNVRRMFEDWLERSSPVDPLRITSAARPPARTPSPR